MVLLHFFAMYLLMYAMVDTFDNILPNINNAYMAALMTAPMLLIETALMGSMHQNQRMQKAVILTGTGLLFLSFFYIRQQAFVYDKELIRSMIPHHAGAILMCERSKIRDSELVQLCDRIMRSQQDEIDQMKKILERLD